MTVFAKAGYLLSIIAVIVVSYMGWHHRVWKKGYDARIAEEQQAIADAQTAIKKEETKYEESLQKIYAAPEGHCSGIVDPSIAIALDGLR